jgi:hypothetical protein
MVMTRKLLVKLPALTEPTPIHQSVSTAADAPPFRLMFEATSRLGPLCFEKKNIFVVDSRR